jgi:Tfp pilus assembly protein PilP
MKKTALLSLLLIFSFCLFGQNKQETDIDQWLYQTEEENIDASRDTVITNDLIKLLLSKSVI